MGVSCPRVKDPRVAGPGTTLLQPEKRVEHIELLGPDICTLDLNTMNSGGEVVINTPRNVRIMAERISGRRAAGDRAVRFRRLPSRARPVGRRHAEGPGLFSLVLGVKYGFSATPRPCSYARSLLPPGAIWSGFGISRAEFPMVAQAYLLGGHVRVGMEDNLYMSKGVLARTNAELVAHAAGILLLVVEVGQALGQLVARVGIALVTEEGN